MTREEAKQAAEVLKAFADGKKIEYSCKDENDWSVLLFSDDPNSDINFDFDKFDFRIKPTPQYRPFENADECWCEMLKHQPFGWMKIKRDGERITLTHLTYLTDGHWFADMFEKMTFADGEPFGVKIDLL